MPKNKAAVALGKLGKGKPKNYTPDERERRRKWAQEMTKRRIAKKKLQVNLPDAEGDTNKVKEGS